MKTIISILALVAISVMNSDPEPAGSKTKAIVSESFASPAVFEFGYNYYLDADMDGQADFLFTTVFEDEHGVIHSRYVVNGLGENKVLSVDDVAAIADEGSPLERFGNISWQAAPVIILDQAAEPSGNRWAGLWSGDRDQYIGIMVVKDGRSYKGWVKVFIDQNAGRARLASYAVNRVAGGDIAAGEL